MRFVKPTWMWRQIMTVGDYNGWVGSLLAGVAMALIGLVAATAVADEPDTSADDEPSAEQIVERIQHFYQQTEDFQAGFIQEYDDIAAGETTRSRGRVYFKKPGMMRWDYYQADRDERDRMLVSDGTNFWVYEYEYQQVLRQCLKDTQLPTSLRFLMGEGDLLEEFEVELTDDATPETPILELTPREPTSHYRKLHFQVDPGSWEVEKTTVFDPYGNTNQIEFRSARVNQNLSEEGFQFEVPPGARELNPEKTCD